MGVANTLWFEGERLFADNTDGVGFVRHLRASVPSFDAGGSAVAVLGAGGGGARCHPCHAGGGSAGGARLQSHARPRRCRRSSFRLACEALRLARPCRPLARRRPADQRHLARHAWHGYARHAARAACPLPASSPIWSTCRWSRLCSRRRGRAASPPWTVSACCCIRRRPASRSGSAWQPEVTDELRAIIVADIEGR